MFLNTYTKDGMQQSVCEYLKVSYFEVKDLFRYASRQANKNTYFDGDIFNQILDNFIIKNAPKDQIDEILFFHLTRRLNSCIDDYNGHNLINLLTKKNPFSDFFKEHRVEFVENDGKIDLIHRSKIKSLDGTWDTNALYLRGRFGYNKGREDFCFNGFAFKDLLCKNSYTRELSGVPELVGVLANFLNRTDIAQDYYEQSTYLCLEYKIPMDKVIFDDDDKILPNKKMFYLLNRILNRLFEYENYHIDDMNDYDNPILRLNDNDTMSSEYFVKKEKVSFFRK